MKVTPTGFAGMTRLLLDIAAQCCRGKLVMTLEGGYNLEALRDSVREVLREMAGRRTTDIHSIIASANPRKTAYVIWRVKRAHRKYWKTLAMSATGEPVTDHFPIMERLRGAMARWMTFFRV
jgi:hypothetical protein